MNDFLDTLIDRHTAAVPQIVPRLRSIYESEISLGIFDSTENSINLETERTVHAQPPMPIEETAQEHVNAGEGVPSADPTTSITSPDMNVEETLQGTFASDSTKRAAEEQPTDNAGVIAPVPSLSAKAIEREEGFSKLLDDSQVTLVPPIISETHQENQEQRKKQVRPDHESRSENQAYVNITLARKDKDLGNRGLNKPIPRVALQEEKASTRINPSTVGPPIGPREADVSQAPQEAPVEKQHQESVRHQPLKAEVNHEPPFAVPTQNRAAVDIGATDRQRATDLSDKVREPGWGVLNPTTSPVMPVIPSVTEPATATPQPEPVINVTIGRVEVRATPPPQKQSPKHEKHNSTMGLDEYLRRRSGGRDR